MPARTPWLQAVVAVAPVADVPAGALALDVARRPPRIAHLLRREAVEVAAAVG
jgi:hypothetical protein